MRDQASRTTVLSSNSLTAGNIRCVNLLPANSTLQKPLSSVWPLPVLPRIRSRALVFDLDLSDIPSDKPLKLTESLLKNALSHADHELLQACDCDSWLIIRIQSNTQQQCLLDQRASDWLVCQNIIGICCNLQFHQHNTSSPLFTCHCDIPAFVDRGLHIMACTSHYQQYSVIVSQLILLFHVNQGKILY